MRFQRLLLIVNPVARTVSQPTLAVIEKAMSADFRLEVTETKERGHANEIATQAVDEGIDLVVVFSGDGTINEVVNALAGTETALGVLPGGATNILVRALGLPTDPVEATGVLIGKALDDDAFKLHLGRADGRYFAVNCGAGVDAAAMARMDAKLPKTKAKFDRVAFRSVAWELMVSYAGKRLELTRVEFDLLATLSENLGKVYTRAQFIDRVWGSGFAITDRTIDSHIKSLRRKLTEAGAPSGLIRTVRGVGYRITSSDERAGAGDDE